MTTVHLSLKSENTKTGPLPVSTTSKDSCPSTCPFMGNGCYAEVGKLAIHWRQVSQGERGMSWDDFCDAIEKLPENQLWRHNQAGDLPGKKNRINRTMLRQLVEAQLGKRGWTYTHYDVTSNTTVALHNVEAVKEANAGGFAVNVSCETPEQVDIAISRGLPAVIALPRNAPHRSKTPGGAPIVVCPAQTQEYMTCAVCKLCAKSERKVVVGFLAHGIRVGAAEAVLEKENS